jgi:hypothetical protein
VEPIPLSCEPLTVQAFLCHPQAVLLHIRPTVALGEEAVVGASGTAVPLGMRSFQGLGPLVLRSDRYILTHFGEGEWEV